MKLYEFEGKRLLKRYGIPIPKGTVCHKTILPKNLVEPPLVLKAQILSGERNKKGGIIFTDSYQAVTAGLQTLLGKSFGGEIVKKVLAEERIDAVHEFYISLSYDTDTRGPVLALSPSGGSDIKDVRLFPVDMMLGLPDFFIRSALYGSRFPQEDISGMKAVVQKLWNIFIDEYALLVEINPLFKTSAGEFIAGDAKIILDDAKVNPSERRLLELGGDIAILASGGGASLLNIDALIRYGGRPANYTEYSGNPPREVVKELTKRVLSKPKLKGCWVVGGTANFTDIYETMQGFLEGLREVRPKPTYPIVIRRDGPRQKEAFMVLKEAAQKEGYDFHLFDSKVPMAESARIMVQLAYSKS